MKRLTILFTDSHTQDFESTRDYVRHYHDTMNLYIVQELTVDGVKTSTTSIFPLSEIRSFIFHEDAKEEA